MKKLSAGVAGTILTLAFSVSAAAAETGSRACIYRSESFSEGAAICVQKGLMLSCSASDERLVWKVAREPGFSEMCREAPPRARGTSNVSRRIRRPALAIRTPSSNAKCFAFNGKTYCE